jgi:hypothetical protein
VLNINSSSKFGFPNVASWICFLAAFVLPITFRIVAFSPNLLPDNRVSECKVLLLFVGAQVVAIGIGAVCVLQVRKKKISAILVRSLVGICIGLLGGLIMLSVALAISIGP